MAKCPACYQPTLFCDICGKATLYKTEYCYDHYLEQPEYLLYELLKNEERYPGYRYGC
jgi:hypothetical protein